MLVNFTKPTVPSLNYIAVQSEVDKNETSEKVVNLSNTINCEQNISAKHYIANFKSDLYRSKDYNQPLTTCFFRDMETLGQAVETIKRNFPKGATILDYACSVGKEPVSILALLDGDDRNLYDIRGLDRSSTSISYAKSGKYSASNMKSDSFIFKKSLIPTKESERYLRDKLLKILKETKPDKDGNRTFEIVRKYKNKIYYEPNKNGDIFDISKLKTEKPVGAVFFRNALYQVMKEKSNGYQDVDSPIFLLYDLVDDIYEKLAPGGVMVLGNCAEDKHYNGMVNIHIRNKMGGNFIPLNGQNPRWFAPTMWMKVR